MPNSIYPTDQRQCYDRNKIPAGLVGIVDNRDTYGLPGRPAFVFANFNQLFKVRTISSSSL